MKILACLLFMANIVIAGTVGLPQERIAIPCLDGDCRVQVFDMTTQTMIVE